MTDRVLDFAAAPARLSIRDGLLVVESGGEVRDTVPCDEIAAVVVSHRQVTYTHAVLHALAAGGAILVACDEKSSPSAMMLPVRAHHAQAERFRRQAALPLPTKKRLWQSIVKSKIRAQARVLQAVTGEDHGLKALLAHVRSGDPDNVEARAARRYWSRLFLMDEDSGLFLRWNDDDPRTHMLNYGYAVLRALTARSICAAGVHPTFSLHHSNVHNPFGLADDLMEPFRPRVDATVAGLASDDVRRGLDSAAKGILIAAVLGRVVVDGESRTLPDVMVRVAQSFAAVVLKERQTLWLPDWQPDEDAGP